MAAAVHTLGKQPAQLIAMDLDYQAPPERISALLRESIQKVDTGDGALIMADVYGATHTNVACHQLVRGQIELITGINLPMLLRVLNYRHLKMDDLIDKALSGGSGGIICAANPSTMEKR